jgi:hypothetical protein
MAQQFTGVRIRKYQDLINGNRPNNEREVALNKLLSQERTARRLKDERDFLKRQEQDFNRLLQQEEKNRQVEEQRILKEAIQAYKEEARRDNAEYFKAKQQRQDEEELQRKQRNVPRLLNQLIKKQYKAYKETIISKKVYNIPITEEYVKSIGTNDKKNPYTPTYYSTPDFTLYENVLIDKIGYAVSLELLDNERVVDSFNTIVNEKEDSIYHHYNYSSKIKNDILELLLNGVDTLRISVYEPVKPIYKKQNFAEGAVHCVFNPIRLHLEKQIMEAGNNKTKRNRVSQLHKLEHFERLYAKGLPEDKIEEVAKALDIGLRFETLFNHSLIVANQKAKSKTFSYINSRLDHAEYIVLDRNQEATLISKEDGIDIIKQCIKEQKFNTYQGTITNPTEILTATNKYIVGDKRSDALYNFTKTFDRGMFLDYIKEKDVCDFIMNGANLVINWKNPTCKKKGVNEIDLNKAYTQFHSYSDFIGFPSCISNIRYTEANHDVCSHIGIYEIMIHKFSFGSRFNRHLSAIGFHTNRSYILTSVWILKLQALGVSLSIMKGAWGKSFDFSFSDEMIEDKMYAIWTGMNLSRDSDLHYKMACDPYFAQIVMGQHETDNVLYNEANQTIMFNKKKNNHFILPHISSFIVSYTQLLVFDEMLKYDIDNIIGSKLDSIVLACDIKPYSNIWKESEFHKMNKYTSEKIFESKSFSAFNNNLDVIEIFGSISPYLGDCFIAGQGGSGKTFRIVGDKGFTKILFSTISWVLISDVMKQFGVHGSSINQLLGFDIYNKKTQSHKERFGSPRVIVLDELSMISKDKVSAIQQMYPYSQLIMLGDYDGLYFQSSLSSDLYIPSSYHLITDDYRSINEETRSFKNDVRELMKQGKPILKYLVNHLPIVKMNRLDYNKDFILSGNHERIKQFTALYEPHHLVMKHSMADVFKKIAGEESYLHGEILEYPMDRTEPRSGFTVHSFQGKTIEGHKCFIDAGHIISNQDLYTGISRVRDIRQLYIIHDEAILYV